jgi:hypothetical protein
MFNITVDDSKVSLFVDFASKKMVKAVAAGITQAGAETAAYVQSRHLTGGTTEDRLGVRSGHLRRSAHGVKAELAGDRIVGGVSAGGGLIYSGVHINSQGHKTVIRAKRNDGSLAIPLRGFSSRTGDIGYGYVKKSSPLDYPKGFLEPFKTKKGNMLLVHKQGRGKKTTFVPYYLLMKSVTVPARVFPEWVATVRRRYIVGTIANSMIGALKKRK